MTVKLKLFPAGGIGCQDTFLITDEKRPKKIATIHAPGMADLLAAAPDLLDALMGVLAVADRKTKEFDAARAAIAKAEPKS